MSIDLSAHHYTAVFDGVVVGYFTNFKCAAHSVVARIKATRPVGLCAVVSTQGTIPLDECLQIWSGRLK